MHCNVILIVSKVVTKTAFIQNLMKQFNDINIFIFISKKLITWLLFNVILQFVNC